MLRLLLILLVALVFESAGVVLLKQGIVQIGGFQQLTVSEIARVVAAAATHPRILLGMLFEALFFFGLLFLMSETDISVLWPLTALSFVFATFAAILFLHERVSSVRWIGVIFIMIGAAFISYSEHANEKPSPPADAPANPGPAAPTHPPRS
jgi:drug/metabolite transporter (DMT)-like permease